MMVTGFILLLGLLLLAFIFLKAGSNLPEVQRKRILVITGFATGAGAAVSVLPLPNSGLIGLIIVGVAIAVLLGYCEYAQLRMLDP